MTLYKVRALFCVSYMWIGKSCVAFVRLEPMVVIHIDDRIRLHGVDLLHYRTFDDDHSSDNSQLNGEVISKKDTAKKNQIQALDKYLDSIDRRYKRLYDDSGGRKRSTSLSSSFNRFTTVCNWLSDSSRMADEERRKQDAMYVLHHAAVASELLLNPRRHELNSNAVRKNKPMHDNSALTEALIAGGFELSGTDEIVGLPLSLPLKKVLGIHKIFRSTQGLLQPLASTIIAVLKGNVLKFTESSRKYLSMIGDLYLFPFVPMAVITYTILFLIR